MTSSHFKVLDSIFFVKCVQSIVVLSLILLFFITNSLVYAQQAGTSIKPATLDKTIDPGVVGEYSVSVENLTSEEQTYFLFTRNISDVKAGGVPVFSKNNEEVTGYELADWITLLEDEITVPANGVASFSYELNVPEDASPGSHFGGVFVSVKAPELENSGAGVGYQVAHIVSVRVSGEVVEQAHIRQFSTSKFLYGSANVEFLVRIQNEGNVMVKPRGPLEIYNMLGTKAGSIIFNDTEAGVFPYTTREFSGVKWEGDSVGFGRYEAILSPVYGDAGAKKTMSSTVVFWVLPMNIIGPALGVLAFIIFVTFVFVRLYISRSLQHLNHERKLINRRRKGGSSTTLLLAVVMLTVTALFLIVLLVLFA